MAGEKGGEPTGAGGDRVPWLQTPGGDYDGGPALSRVVGLV